MSRKANTRSVWWTTSAGISPATMRQNRQSDTLATLEGEPPVCRGARPGGSPARHTNSLVAAGERLVAVVRSGGPRCHGAVRRTAMSLPARAHGEGRERCRARRGGAQDFGAQPDGLRPGGAEGHDLAVGEPALGAHDD